MSEIRGPDKGRTMVVERGGRAVLGGLEKKDPFQKQGCKYGEECLADEGEDCSKVGVCYEIRCTKCEMTENGGGDVTNPPQNTQARIIAGKRRIYVGNTGKSAHSRMREHRVKLRRKDKNSCLHKHMVKEHEEGESPNFKMKTLSSHRTNLQRMIAEGIAIEKIRRQNPENLLNSKAEWGRAKLVRHTATSVIF